MAASEPVGQQGGAAEPWGRRRDPFGADRAVLQRHEAASGRLLRVGSGRGARVHDGIQ